MTTLIELFHKKARVGKHTMVSKRVVVGRGSDCQIRLEEDLASREHATIYLESGAYWVEDLGSRNGTWVNGQRLTQRQKLKNGDSISIGAHELRFVSDIAGAIDEQATRAAVVDDKDVPKSRKVQLKRSDLRWLARLKVSEGYLKGEVFENWDGCLRIGRSPDNEVPLISDEFLSAQHAEITQQDGQYFLMDLGSDNGTFVNKRRIPPGQREQLKHGDKIRIGKNSQLDFGLIDRQLAREFRKRAFLAFAIVIVVCLAIIKFRPDDLSGEHFQKAEAAFQRGQLEEAMVECQFALNLQPTFTDAQNLKRNIEVLVRANKDVRLAHNQALGGKFAEAEANVQEVLRTVPQHAGGLELSAVLKSIGIATEAIKKQNWRSSIHELESARARFKGSEVVSNLLTHAKSELASNDALTQAKEYQSLQPERAEEFAKSIPTNSMYRPAALTLLKVIEMNRSKTKNLALARETFRETGDVEKSLRLIVGGLKDNPGEPSFVALQEQIIKSATLVKEIPSSSQLGERSSLEELMAGVKACDNLVGHIADPLNFHSKRASTEKARLQGLLASYAEQCAAEATKIETSGSRKEACLKLMEAARANPGAREITQRLDRLRLKILQDVTDHYFAGYQLVDRDNTEAIRRFIAVTNIGLPNLSTNPKELYFEKALDQLKNLKR